uniref:HID1 protein n=1 Tax=Macrostomum lignano TaxID=282301 RepID=A0A1I8GD64_9PLAT
NLSINLKNQPVEASDNDFWDQFWSEFETTVQDIFILIPAAEIRALREESPSNLATLCYKAVEKLVSIAETSYHTQKEQQTALNCIRLLTRILPYIFEEPDWITFFWSPQHQSGERDEENPEDLNTIDSCEYIWQAGVGFASTPVRNAIYDSHRTEILKLLLTCFSETMYLPSSEAHTQPNRWIAYFTSTENRHALPLFTSLLNTVCAYDPIGYVPSPTSPTPAAAAAAASLLGSTGADLGDLEAGPDNLFVNYMSRVHREEDFAFILRGIARLLNNPLVQTYLPGSCKRIHFYQELLILFWKMCDINKKFMFYVLKSSDILDLLVPVLYYLNDARADQSRVGLMHIGVFILLLLSGERNFGVRLNKPYQIRVPMDIPVFTGTHADLLIIVFHKIITTGHQRLQPLFDCLLTIVVNVSPYLKSLSMVSANKLLHLLEAFSTPWFLFSTPGNHHLVFFLLEVFNNIIQYQFDGNSSLVYCIIRKRAQQQQQQQQQNSQQHPASVQSNANDSQEGSTPAAPAEPGTLKTSLEATPALTNMTERSRPTPAPTPTRIPVRPLLTGRRLRHPATAQSRQHPPPCPRPNPCSRRRRRRPPRRLTSTASSSTVGWVATPDWVSSWKSKLPLQTIMRLLQVLVPQVEKICIDKGLTDDSEILKFLQHGTLVGLLPVPHPILIRKYQANAGTTIWFRTYMWGVIYLRNVDPPIWYDTDVRLFEIQRV